MYAYLEDLISSQLSKELCYVSFDWFLTKKQNKHIVSKIEENTREPEHLHTIRGMGYKFLQWIDNQYFLQLV